MYFIFFLHTSEVLFSFVWLLLPSLYVLVWMNFIGLFKFTNSASEISIPAKEIGPKANACGIKPLTFIVSQFLRIRNSRAPELVLWLRVCHTLPSICHPELQSTAGWANTGGSSSKMTHSSGAACWQETSGFPLQTT